ncbi:hypothetical protein QYE76_066508 [Lolium multiflorum]|uniref:Integrase zinc-binding domain-containing protein n=1 Tax=Lolium multiflorum TaxID=4521 RepID=A0AAD8SCF1_LOLMU|nr:hypothetical protein QYE76_066508 [Lolium multiflorum]
MPLVLMYKGEVLVSNDMTPISLGVSHVLQEFGDVFPEEVPAGLPSLRGTEHQIDLNPGASLPNRAPYRTNPEETKEIQKQESHAGGLMGHFGREKTLLILADHFYWPNMRRDVDKVNMEASKRADFVWKIHEKTKELIEKKGKNNAARMNKKCKEMLLKPGDMAWVHFRKDRYEDKGSIARGGGEQLDMVLEMKTSHERAREEREACAKEGEEEVQDDATLDDTDRHAGQPAPHPAPPAHTSGDRRLPAPAPVHRAPFRSGAPPVRGRSMSARLAPGPVDRPPRRPCPSQSRPDPDMGRFVVVFFDFWSS